MLRRALSQPPKAMAAGCPFVATRSGCISEICGDSIEYCAPGDSDSLMAAKQAVVTSPARVAQLRVAGRARASLFYWKRCAAETAAIYRSLA